MRTDPRFAGACLRGERHQLDGQPCCDALLLRPAGFVICDGAGCSTAVACSAARGARAAWWALGALHRQLRRSPRTPRPLLQQRFRGAFLNRRRGVPLLDHTVLACRWDRHGLLIAQVGDSSLLLRRHGHWELPLCPLKGESANETTFLREQTPASSIGLYWTPTAAVEAVIAFSDGLEAAFLAPCPGEPDRFTGHGALADLVLLQHQARRGSHSYTAWLEASLKDPALAQLSDDDRTLVIASR